MDKFKEKKAEFQRGYAAGVDDMKSMSYVDIVRVVNGDLKMARLVHYYHHGENDISESYLEGWARAVKDVRKGASEGQR